MHSPGRIKIAERRVRQWSKFGAPVELLSREQTRDMLGSDAWFGGFWNKTGGHINPLALARGLARTVLGLGARIYARSPAESFERRNDRWVVKTAKGEISGRALVVATNAYSGEFSKSLVPEIAHEVMPVLSWQMATQPLSDNVRKTIIPGRQAMSDTHGELYFARYDARNRLVTGGAVIGPGNKVERIKARVTERLQRLWPQIGEVSFDYVWNGYVGMTTDFLPRIHKLGPNAYGWTGCNGRAVALTIPLGNELAKAVRGVPESELALPFTEPVPIVGPRRPAQTGAADAAGLSPHGMRREMALLRWGLLPLARSLQRGEGAATPPPSHAPAQIRRRGSSRAAPAYRDAAGCRTLRPPARAPPLHRPSSRRRGRRSARRPADHA